jgi:hypothetical protein
MADPVTATDNARVHVSAEIPRHVLRWFVIMQKILAAFDANWKLMAALIRYLLICLIEYLL